MNASIKILKPQTLCTNSTKSTNNAPDPLYCIHKHKLYSITTKDTTSTTTTTLKRICKCAQSLQVAGLLNESHPRVFQTITLSFLLHLRLGKVKVS